MVATAVAYVVSETLKQEPPPSGRPTAGPGNKNTTETTVSKRKDLHQTPEPAAGTIKPLLSTAGSLSAVDTAGAATTSQSYTADESSIAKKPRRRR
jgi:hypothetical protein